MTAVREQTGQVHIHTPAYRPDDPGHRMEVTRRLGQVDYLMDKILDLRGAETWSAHRDSQDSFFRAAARDTGRFREMWFEEIRPLLVAELNRFMIQPTSEIIPCTSFGRTGPRHPDRICLSWVTADTPETFAALWDHLVAFHGSQKWVNWNYADLLTQLAFLRYRIATEVPE